MQGTSTISNKMSALYDNFCSKFNLVRCTPCERIQRPGKGGKKHEIYAAAFDGHLFMTYFYRAGGGVWRPWPPWIRYCHVPDARQVW